MAMAYFAVYQNTDITNTKKNIAQIPGLGVDSIPCSQAWVESMGGGGNETTAIFVVAGTSSWISIAANWTKSSGLYGIEEKTYGKNA